MKVLVTGAAGYIGSCLIGTLLKNPAIKHVYALDRRAECWDSLGQYCSARKFEFIHSDVRSIMKYRYALVDVDVVIHLAAIVGQHACDDDEVGAWNINVDATGKLVENLSRNQHLIFANTNSGYGRGSFTRACTETSPLNPLSLYGNTKVIAENIITKQHPNHTVFRFATCFGWSPSMRWNLLVNTFVLDAVSRGNIRVFEGHYRRNFLHVRDAANAFNWACVSDKAKGQIFNCGLSNANITKLELAKKVQSYVSNSQVFEIAGRDIDQRDYYVSNDKLQKAGFCPTLDLDYGIYEVVKVAGMWGFA